VISNFSDPCHSPVEKYRLSGRFLKVTVNRPRKHVGTQTVAFKQLAWLFQVNV